MVEGTESRTFIACPLCYEKPVIDNGNPAEAPTFRENKAAIMYVVHLTGEGPKDMTFSARQRDVNEKLTTKT